MLVQSEKLPQAQRIFLLLGLARSTGADFSQTPLMVSYFSLMVMLLSVHAIFKWGIASLCPAFVGRLSLVLYQLVVPARHAENVYQNIGARLNFTDFCQTTGVSISAHISKCGKHTNAHHHSPIWVFIVTASKLEATPEKSNIMVPGPLCMLRRV